MNNNIILRINIEREIEVILLAFESKLLFQISQPSF